MFLFYRRNLVSPRASQIKVSVILQGESIHTSLLFIQIDKCNIFFETLCSILLMWLQVGKILAKILGLLSIIVCLFWGKIWCRMQQPVFAFCFLQLWKDQLEEKSWNFAAERTLWQTLVLQFNLGDHKSKSRGGLLFRVPYPLNALFIKFHC